MRHLRSVHGRLHENKQSRRQRSRAKSHNFHTSSEKKTKFVGNKTAIYGRNRSSYVFSLSNSSVFVSFLRSSDRSHTKEQAGSMPSTQAVAPSTSHNRDGSEKVRMFDKRTHRHKLFDRERFASVLSLRHAQLRVLLEVIALTGECSPPDQNRSSFRSNFCRHCSKFHWALPLSLSSPWNMNFFLRNDKYRQECASLTTELSSFSFFFLAFSLSFFILSPPLSFNNHFCLSFLKCSFQRASLAQKETLLLHLLD